jgi:hypothetical protein
MMQAMAILSGRDSNEEKQKAAPYNRLVDVMETYVFEPPPEKQ